MARPIWLLAPILLLGACGDDPADTDGGVGIDATIPFDTGISDVGDGGTRDTGGADGSDAGPDLGPIDPWEPPTSVDWAPCTEGGLAGLECTRLAVPLDHEAPRARIELALARSPAGDPARRLGVILVNPGGPGGRSREFPW